VTLLDELSGAICEARNSFHEFVKDMEGDWPDYDDWLARACAAVLARRLDAILSADGDNDGVFDQLFALLAELEPSTDAEGGRERG